MNTIQAAIAEIVAEALRAERVQQADRLQNAAASLASMKHQTERITAKREGVLLALSYIEEDLRVAAGLTP